MTHGCLLLHSSLMLALDLVRMKGKNLHSLLYSGKNCQLYKPYKLLRYSYRTLNFFNLFSIGHFEGVSGVILCNMEDVDWVMVGHFGKPIVLGTGLLKPMPKTLQPL